MGAVFEVSIISKKCIPLEISIGYLQQFGLSFSAETFQSIKDWTWSGKQELPMNEREHIEPLLKAGKIVQLYGTLAGANAGVFVERNEDLTYQTDLWFDEAVYPLTGVSAPVGTKTFFEKLEAKLEDALTGFFPYDMVLAVMGEEIVFQYSSDLAQAKKCCKADRWIQFEDRGTV